MSDELNVKTLREIWERVHALENAFVALQQSLGKLKGKVPKQ